MLDLFSCDLTSSGPNKFYHNPDSTIVPFARLATHLFFNAIYGTGKQKGSSDRRALFMRVVTSRALSPRAAEPGISALGVDERSLATFVAIATERRANVARTRNVRPCRHLHIACGKRSTVNVPAVAASERRDVPTLVPGDSEAPVYGPVGPFPSLPPPLRAVKRPGHWTN